MIVGFFSFVFVCVFFFNLFIVQHSFIHSSPIYIQTYLAAVRSVDVEVHSLKGLDGRLCVVLCCVVLWYDTMFLRGGEGRVCVGGQL